MDSKSIWPVLGHITRFGVAFSLIGYFWYTGKFDISSVVIAMEQPNLLISSFFLLLISMFIAVERWYALLEATGVKCSKSLAIRLTFIGTFFSVALPGALGGDVVKAYYLARGRERKTALIMTVFFDRLLGLYTMILVAASASIVVIGVNTFGEPEVWWSPTLKGLAIFLIVAFIVFTIAIALLLSPYVERISLVRVLLKKLQSYQFFNNIYESLRAYRGKKLYVGKALLFSLISQFFGYCSLYLLALSLKIQALNFFHYLFVLPVCFFINAIPLAPGGLGVGEVGFGKIFGLFGSDQGVALAVLYHIVYFLIALGIGGVVYLFSGKQLKEMSKTV